LKNSRQPRLARSGLARDYSITRIAFAVQRDNAAELASAIFEGVCFGDFYDQNWKSKPVERKDLEITFVVAAEHVKAVTAALTYTGQTDGGRVHRASSCECAEQRADTRGPDRDGR
jgi:hypothetical protein